MKFNKIIATISLISLLLSHSAFGVVRSFGHNLSRTDYIFEDHRCTIGLQFSGCRIDSSLVGTSPFLLRFYNMSNVFVRHQLGKNDNVTHTAEVAYLDTFNEDKRRYDMKAILGTYIYSTKINSVFSNHLNISYYHFSYKKYPFSLHRPDPKNKTNQINLSTLFEATLTDHFQLLGEIGILQLNGKFPHLHSGASVGYGDNNFRIQFGYTLSATLAGLFVSPENSQRNDYQQELLAMEDGYLQDFDRYKMEKDFALHPEITIQYFF